MNVKINTIIERQRAVISAVDYWAGDAYSSKIDSLTEHEAFRRPVPGVHTVAELLSHVLAWRRDSMAKISGIGPSPLGMDSYEDWIPNEDLMEKGWEHLKQEFYASVNTLCELLAERDDSFLLGRPKGDERSYGFILDGLINHDIYHLGQIGMVLKLIRSLD